MTLRDLFTGQWTWLQLLREVAPLLIASAATFFAGYRRGRRVELDQIIRILEAGERHSSAGTGADGN